MERQEDVIANGHKNMGLRTSVLVREVMFLTTLGQVFRGAKTYFWSRTSMFLVGEACFCFCIRQPQRPYFFSTFFF